MSNQKQIQQDSSSPNHTPAQDAAATVKPSQPEVNKSDTIPPTSGSCATSSQGNNITNTPQRLNRKPSNMTEIFIVPIHAHINTCTTDAIDHGRNKSSPNDPNTILNEPPIKTTYILSSGLLIPMQKMPRRSSIMRSSWIKKSARPSSKNAEKTDSKINVKIQGSTNPTATLGLNDSLASLNALSNSPCDSSKEPVKTCDSSKEPVKTCDSSKEPVNVVSKEAVKTESSNNQAASFKPTNNKEAIAFKATNKETVIANKATSKSASNKSGKSSKKECPTNKESPKKPDAAEKLATKQARKEAEKKTAGKPSTLQLIKSTSREMLKSKEVSKSSSKLLQATKSTLEPIKSKIASMITCKESSKNSTDKKPVKQSRSFLGFKKTSKENNKASTDNPAPEPSKPKTKRNFIPKWILHSYDRRPITHFTLRLHRLVATMQDNVFVSPFGVAFALSIILAGSQEKTAQQIYSCLEVATMIQLLTEFDSMGSSLGHTNEHHVCIGNKLYTSTTMRVCENFKLFIAEEFFTQVTPVDFKGCASSAAREINSWLQRTTFGKLTHAVSANEILHCDKNVMHALLVSAIYVKITWCRITHHFTVHRIRKFFNDPSESDTPIAADVMYTRCLANFATLHYLDCKVLELPVQNEMFSFLIMLPHRQSSVEDLLDKLMFEDIRDLPSIFKRCRMDIYLPKFVIDNSLRLKHPLMVLGIEDLFDRDKCDLGLMYDTNEEKTCLSEMKHKTRIEVSDCYDGSSKPLPGQTAALGPWMSTPLKRPLIFKVNRPFVFALVEATTRSILGMGVVKKPSPVSTDNKTSSKNKQ